MKIRTPTEFLTFSDGFCDIYTVKGNRLDAKLLTLCFGDRTVGMKRYYAARAASVEITRLIQVPRQKSIEAVHRAVINGAEYKIEQVQHLSDTNPPATLLTLRKVG
jgi:hypothetical protein